MKLSQSLEGKKVKIMDISGEIFEGVVLDYIYIPKIMNRKEFPP